MAIEPDIHDPDWERYFVAAQGGVAPVGDPTRWGSQVFTRIFDNGFPEQIIFSGQMLQMATQDNYARPWNVIGTLTLPQSVWLSTAVEVDLEVTMGVGQIQIVHRIGLVRSFRSTQPPGWPITPPGPFATIPIGGLCIQQSQNAGGPYAETTEPTTAELPVAGELQDICRPFACIGALVGQSISMRARYRRWNVSNGLPCLSRLAVIVTPYAAGEGL